MRGEWRGGTLTRRGAHVRRFSLPRVHNQKERSAKEKNEEDERTRPCSCTRAKLWWCYKMGGCAFDCLCTLVRLFLPTATGRSPRRNGYRVQFLAAGGHWQKLVYSNLPSPGSIQAQTNSTHWSLLPPGPFWFSVFLGRQAYPAPIGVRAESQGHKRKVCKSWPSSMVRCIGPVWY